VADLGVSHLALRKPHAPAVDDESTVRAALGRGVERRRVGRRDRVASRRPT